MEIFVYKINGNEINIFKDYLDIIDNRKQKQIINYKNDIDKSRSLIAHLIIYSYFKGKVKYDYNEYGKITNLMSNIKFSISHSGNYVVVAFNSNEIGIDIEKRSILKEEINEFVSEEEKLYFKHHDFIKLWCLKESYLKYTGYGLNDDILNIKFYIKNKKIKCLNNQNLSFKEINIDKEYVCILASNNIRNIKIMNNSEDDLMHKMVF